MTYTKMPAAGVPVAVAVAVDVAVSVGPVAVAVGVGVGVTHLQQFPWQYRDSSLGQVRGFCRHTPQARARQPSRIVAHGSQRSLQ